MIDGLSPLAPLRGPFAPQAPGQTDAVPGERSFREILQDSIRSVNTLQTEADQVLAQYARGEATEVELTIAFKKAQIAFEALLQIRNKLVGAFEEIQRMRI